MVSILITQVFTSFDLMGVWPKILGFLVVYVIWFLVFKLMMLMLLLAMFVVVMLVVIVVNF